MYRILTCLHFIIQDLFTILGNLDPSTIVALVDVLVEMFDHVDATGVLNIYVAVVPL